MADDSEFPEHKHEEARRDIGRQVQAKRRLGIGSGDALVTGTLQGVGDRPFVLYKIVGPDNRTLLTYPGGLPKYKLVADEDPAPSSQASDPDNVGGRRRKTHRRRRSTSARTSKRLRRKTARASASSRGRRARKP